MLRLSAHALLLIVACAILALAVSAQSEASKYHDCDSCVENGWGWSWSKNQCGGFLNTNCDPDSAEALDEEEDEDFSAPPTKQEEVDDTPFVIPAPAPIPTEPLEWRNTESTTLLWNLMNSGDITNFAAWSYREPGIVHLRSEDGRGALFWAYEYGKWELVDFLLERGADPEATDASGNKPEDLTHEKKPKSYKKTLDVDQAIARAKQSARK